MDIILDLVKARLGISVNSRDPFLNAIIESVVTEITVEKGIKLDLENASHTMFIVDYSVYRYQSRDSSESLPEHLGWRMRNLYINNGGD